MGNVCQYLSATESKQYYFHKVLKSTRCDGWMDGNNFMKHRHLNDTHKDTRAYTLLKSSDTAFSGRSRAPEQDISQVLSLIFIPEWQNTTPAGFATLIQISPFRL